MKSLLCAKVVCLLLLVLLTSAALWLYWDHASSTREQVILDKALEELDTSGPSTPGKVQRLETGRGGL